MGLDMYLNIRKGESSYEGFMVNPNVPLVLPAEVQPLVDAANLPLEESRDENVRGDRKGFFPHSVTRVTDYRLGYWRKANWIHNWFVEHCADGVDECQDIHVSKEDLESLLAILQKVDRNQSKKVAAELLPTRAGFFFGGTDYGEYYFKEVKRSIPIIQAALNIASWEESRWKKDVSAMTDEEKNSDYEIIYSASW